MRRSLGRSEAKRIAVGSSHYRLPLHPLREAILQGCRFRLTALELCRRVLDLEVARRGKPVSAVLRIAVAPFALTCDRSVAAIASSKDARQTQALRPRPSA